MSIEVIKQYLTGIASFKMHGSEYYQYLLDHGKMLTETRPCKPLCQLGKVKQCYLNAQRTALFNSRLTYYEGYAMSEGLVPVEHAWIVYRGKVLDPTWERWEHERKAVYFGMSVPKVFISAYWFEHGIATNLLARYLVQSGKVKLKNPLLESIVTGFALGTGFGIAKSVFRGKK